MGSRSMLRSVLTLAFVLAAWVGLGASTAWAQDYTVSTTTGQWATPPSYATNFGLVGDDSTKTLDSTSGFPPFAINFYGRTYTSATVSTNGFLQFGKNGGAGCCSASAGPFASGATYDGMCAVAWCDLIAATGSLTPTIYVWTDGTAPYRRFVIAWTNWSRYSTYSGTLNFQAQFFETTGDIILAYTGTWSQSGPYGVGIDDYGTSRYSRAPAGETSGLYTFSTTPPNDWLFRPKQTRFTGTLLMDALVSDSSGYGNATQLGVPAPGVAVELRNTSGSVLASTTTAADGTYTVAGLALDSSQSGSIHLSTNSTVCSVLPTLTGTIYSKQIAASLSFGADVALGTYTLNNSNDSGGAFRAPAEIATAMGRAYNWVRARTSKSIPGITVLYDTNSTETTRYVAAAGTTPAYIRIGSAACGNPDAYDPVVVMRAYSRHLVKSISNATAPNTPLNIDQKQDAVSSLADGLGVYLAAVVDGATKQYDGVSASVSNTYDFENPSLTTAKAPEVGGWFGAAMYDLVDASNEAHDTIDGTVSTNAERPFQVYNSLTNFSVIGFVYDWNNRGYGGAALATNLIYHGILPDDSAEMNDTQGAAHDLGIAGQLRRGQYLSPFNDDWYKITVPEAVNVFTMDMVYAYVSTDAQIVTEIRTPGGSVLATGAWDDVAGAYRARTGALAAGDYILRISHTGGGYLGQYDLQASAPLSVSAGGPTAWTVNRPIVSPLTIKGGVGPYRVIVKPGTLLPVGLALNAASGNVSGTPTEPGEQEYTLVTNDSGSPVTTITTTLGLRINPALRFGTPVLNGIASGKSTNLSLGRSGGTDPIVISDLSGTLPEGLILTEDFVITGVTNSSGGGNVSFVATDAAGDSTNVSTTLVACPKIATAKQAIDLAAGSGAASGFFFDTVSDTTATITITTAKKRIARDLDVVVVGPDGQAVQGGSQKVARGKISIKNLPLTQTGRYFVVFSGRDALGATQMLATLKTALPKRGGDALTFDFGDTEEFDFGALNGATVTVSGTTTLKMAMRVFFIERPDGSLYENSNVRIDESTGKFKFTFTTDMSGTWTMTIGPKPGPVGDLKYSYSIKQPTGVEFSVD